MREEVCCMEVREYVGDRGGVVGERCFEGMRES